MFKIKPSVDQGWLIVEYDDELRLEELKGCVDGKKVRCRQQILFPEEAIINIPGIIDKSEEVIFEGQTEEIFKKVYSTYLTIITNVKKIKESYFRDSPPFNYKYTGVYPKILKHQKVMYNMMFYTNKCGILPDAGTCKTGPYLWVINQRLKMGSIKKALIITLSDLKENVFNEIKLQCPEMYEKTVVIENTTHAKMIIDKLYKKKENKEYDVYINNYESMRSFIPIFRNKIEFDMVICDEAHRISHTNAKQTKEIIKGFENVRYKYAITGTLNSNFLLSFFGAWRFLGPDTVPYASFDECRRRFMRSVDPDGRVWIPLSKNHVESVAKIIGNISVKYTKDECLDLPGVVYHKIYYDMTAEQEHYYKQASKNMLLEFDNICSMCNRKDTCKRSEVEKCSNTVQLKNALVMTGKLAQIAMGFYNNKRVIIDDDEKEIDDSNTIFFSDNQRMKILRECLEQIGENKVIVWCYSVIFMKNIVEPFLKKGYGDSLLTCYGPGVKAYDIVQKFKELKYNILLGNPTKLGVGQNIQFTNYQIFLNNSFSYLSRDQAISRQDRQGQTKKVSVFDILAKKSIDLGILKCLDNKRDLDITLSKFSRLVKGEVS